MSPLYSSPRFEAAKLPRALPNDVVRPHPVVITTEGSASLNAYFVARETYFQCLHHAYGWQPLLLYVLPDCDWLLVDAALREVADDRYYVEALPEVFESWSAWRESVVGLDEGTRPVLRRIE